MTTPRSLLLLSILAFGCLGTSASDGDDEGGDADSDSDVDSDVDSDTGTGTGSGTGSGTDVGCTLDPPFGETSGGSGGGTSSGEARQTPDGIDYRIIAPAGATGLMIVFSGTEGGQTMMMNLQQAGPPLAGDDIIFAILDGVTYYGDGDPGASVLDDVRADYDIDNDRTYLLSESAGTRSGLELGFQLRESYFAAFWANDVNASDVPGQTAAQIGFAPWGNAGPGGDYVDADVIVGGMRDAGYQIEDPAPYDGPGAGTHGAPQQFQAALEWFAGGASGAPRRRECPE